MAPGIQRYKKLMEQPEVPAPHKLPTTRSRSAAAAHSVPIATLPSHKNHPRGRTFSIIKCVAEEEVFLPKEITNVLPRTENNVKGRHGLRDPNGVGNRGEAGCCCYKHTYGPEQDSRCRVFIIVCRIYPNSVCKHSYLLEKHRLLISKVNSVFQSRPVEY